jgi:hypothetical protein
MKKIKKYCVSAILFWKHNNDRIEVLLGFCSGMIKHPGQWNSFISVQNKEEPLFQAAIRKAADETVDGNRDFFSDQCFHFSRTPLVSCGFPFFSFAVYSCKLTGRMVAENWYRCSSGYENIRWFSVDRLPKKMCFPVWIAVKKLEQRIRQNVSDGYLYSI